MAHRNPASFLAKDLTVSCSTPSFSSAGRSSAATTSSDEVRRTNTFPSVGRRASGFPPRITTSDRAGGTIRSSFPVATVEKAAIAFSLPVVLAHRSPTSMRRRKVAPAANVGEGGFCNRSAWSPFGRDFARASNREASRKQIARAREKAARVVLPSEEVQFTNKAEWRRTARRMEGGVDKEDISGPLHPSLTSSSASSRPPSLRISCTTSSTEVPASPRCPPNRELMALRIPPSTTSMEEEDVLASSSALDMAVPMSRYN
mmetsp:Transcript_29274/g.67226  ORF Transcript_29274/g.67226 Transcript_29274/m.67226 type:complete len:260 (-) Transcript_29274:237-1016(-)